MTKMGYVVICEVRNSGRMAQFEVTIDRVEGAQEPLPDPHVHLLWWDRSESVVEEIPPGGIRPIAVGRMSRMDATLIYQSISPAGIIRDPVTVAKDGESLTVWFTIAARNLLTTSYMRRIGVEIRWPKGAVGPVAKQAPDPPGAEVRSSIPSFDQLLDF